jgi:dipeptidyl aminopeptidase/acylaminoacyl peptidase
MRLGMLCCLVFVLPVWPQEATRSHTITTEDYFRVHLLTEIAVSPDGKQVAYVLGTWNKAEDNRRMDLWVLATNGEGKPKRLTHDRANDRHVRWSADSKYVYFLGNRKREAEKKPPYDGTSQVWRVAADGSGSVEPITRHPGGVSSFDYAPKTDAIYFSVTKTHADDDDFAKLRAKFKADYGHGIRKVSEIHKIDLATSDSEKVVDDTRYIREFCVTADGKRIAMVSAFDDTVVKSEGESRVDVWEAGKVTTPPIDAYRKNPANSPYAWLENLCWNADGSRFAFTAVHDAYPAEVIVGTAGEKEWSVARVDRAGQWEVVGYGRAMGPPLIWTGAEKLLVMVERTGSIGMVNVTLSDPIEMGKPEFVEGVNIYAYSEAPNSFGGVYLLSSTTHFPVLAKSHSLDKLLFDPNPHAKTWKLPTVRHVVWRAPDGSGVGGVLEVPYGYDPKKDGKLPLVVAIHGGPTTSTKNELSFDPHNGRLYFANAGYAVLCPNYRGSTGYGDKFVTDLVGRENDIEVKDILAGIQHLIKEGLVDENRVGVMGWSNGGYLTNCLISLKNPPVQIRAASSGAGIVDTVAEWGFNDEPAYPIVFKKGLPWEQPEIYIRTSPTYQLGNIKTPTLVHVGGNDVRCPPGHSQMLYRALKENLKVPTELISYPGEPHGLTKYSNRKAKMEWDLAWFEKYLKNGK